MLQDLLDRAADQLLDQRPFVLYRKPHQQSIRGIFQHNDELHFSTDLKETGFVLAPFNDREPTILLHVHEFLEAEYQSVANPEKGQGKETWQVQSQVGDKVVHMVLLEKAMEAIKKGSFKKVVLSRQMEVPLDKDPLDIFVGLVDSYPSAFCYLWYHPKVGLWCGASPELLLSLENQRFTTMSLAGTQPYSQGTTAHWGGKEKMEQAMVTNYIIEILKTRLTDLEVSGTTTVKAGNLWHLRTDISGKLASADLQGLVKVLHPTPAVGGVPMALAKEFILQNENHSRDFYTGYLGELNFRETKERTTSRRNMENKAYDMVRNKTSLFVNLRCMRLLDRKALIYVGGGITENSIPEREWQETVSKSATMLKVLQK